MAIEFPKDEEGYTLDENGERVLPDEPQMSRKTGKRKKANTKIFTQAKVDKICELIVEGNFIKDAVQRVGIKPNTYYSELVRKGKKGIRPYNEWYEQIEIAKAQAVTDKVSILSNEMKNGNVGVIQWWLARMHPNQWERTERIKAEVDNSQTINIVRFSDKHKDKEEE